MESRPANCLLASPISLLVIATSLALLSAAVGVWMTGIQRAGSRLIMFSAGLLVGIAAFGVWPELAREFGWPVGMAGLLGGFGLLWFINRYVYAVCPACSHTHDHESCPVTLHGFATPLIAAAILHSLMDGWSIAASQHQGEAGLGLAVFAGVSLHKIPEGLAYGGILRAATRSRWTALVWCAAAQGFTLIGGALDSLAAPHLASKWLGVPLALAGGSFLFLGSHAVHQEWRRSGAAPAFGPALTGAAGAAALQQGLQLLLR